MRKKELLLRSGSSFLRSFARKCFSCRRGTGPTFSRKSRQKAGDGVASGNPLDCPVWKRGAQFGLTWVKGFGFLLCRLVRERAPDPFPNRAGDFPALLMSPVVPAAWVVFSFGSKEQRSLDDEGTLLFWLINRSHKRAGRPFADRQSEEVGTNTVGQLCEAVRGAGALPLLRFGFGGAVQACRRRRRRESRVRRGRPSGRP